MRELVRDPLLFLGTFVLLPALGYLVGAQRERIRILRKIMSKRWGGEPAELLVIAASEPEGSADQKKALDFYERSAQVQAEFLIMATQKLMEEHPSWPVKWLANHAREEWRKRMAEDGPKAPS